MDFKVAVAAPADVSAAVEVWRAANTPRGLPPTEQRVQRVVEKLQAVDACVVLGRTGLRVTAVALAEPNRAEPTMAPARWCPAAGTCRWSSYTQTYGARAWARH